MHMVNSYFTASEHTPSITVLLDPSRVTAGVPDCSSTTTDTLLSPTHAESTSLDGCLSLKNKLPEQTVLWRAGLYHQTVNWIYKFIDALYPSTGPSLQIESFSLTQFTGPAALCLRQCDRTWLTFSSLQVNKSLCSVY